MPVHPLVTQLRFARSEFRRCFVGVQEAEARQRLLPMNCLSWIVGHLANQEQRYWLIFAQGQTLYPNLYDLVGFGKPASTPPWNEMWSTWQGITQAADLFLDTLTPQTLTNYLKRDGKPVPENTGTLLMRNIYHYFYHIGEASAIRQMLGHKNLPDFVGDMDEAQYHPE
jgi:uncharacterized damage-inducible protein DinB